MPKKINVSKDKILDITDRILQDDGYRALSVRKIAHMSGMATGTFYLYFPSKDVLVAMTLARTWERTTADMKLVSSTCTDFAEGVKKLYGLMCGFLQKYRATFAEYSRSVGSHETLASRHIMLRSQIAERMRELADLSGRQFLGPHADILAECLLAVLNQNDMDESTLCSFVALIEKQKEE